MLVSMDVFYILSLFCLYHTNTLNSQYLAYKWIYIATLENFGFAFRKIRLQLDSFSFLFFDMYKICPVEGTEVIEKPEFYSAATNP